MDTDSVVLRERRSLARDGVVVVCAGVDPDGELSGPIQVAGSGFMDPADAKHAFKRLAEAVEMGVSGDLPADDPDKARANIRKVARQFLRNDLNKRPMIIPVILDT